MPASAASRAFCSRSRCTRATTSWTSATTLRATLRSVQATLPPDVKLDLVADQPSVVSERIRDFFGEFGIAIVAVILVTMLLLPLRVALVSAIAIPVTVSMTFGMLNACGIELQQVSIAALIVVLGMVVDDAIVIADNYVELLDRKVPIDEAAERCATEMAVPVLTATLTIIAAFAPLLMLTGAVGEFIRALPIAVAISLGTSFVVAMLLTPLMARFFIRKGLRDHEQEDAAAAAQAHSAGPHAAVLQHSHHLGHAPQAGGSGYRACWRLRPGLEFYSWCRNCCFRWPSGTSS